MRAHQSLTCVSIASSDSSGGGGIAADIKAFSKIRVHGACVLTAVTAQNTLGVQDYHPLPLQLIGDQLDMIDRDLQIDAIKVGVVGNAELLRYLAEKLTKFAERGIPIVFDPVMVTAAGSQIGETESALQELRTSMLPLVTVVTPNLTEAQLIAGTTEALEPHELARTIASMGARSVVVTNSLRSDVAMDWLHTGRLSVGIGGGRRSDSNADHGAGCTHSALIAAFLAQGLPLVEAATEAHCMISEAMALSATDIGNGRHPLDIAHASKPSGLVAASA